jgi:hypothetical protein
LFISRSTARYGPAANVIDTAKQYSLGEFVSGNTHVTFKYTGDGAYIISSQDGNLALPDNTHDGRAWGTLITTSSTTSVGAQWYLLPDRSGDGSTATGLYRIVNRFSGLYLSVFGDGGLETVPGRSWTDASGSTVGGGRTQAAQTFKLTAY